MRLQSDLSSILKDVKMKYLRRHATEDALTKSASEILEEENWDKMIADQ